MDVIREFKGEYSFLSNFYPVWVEFEGEPYPSVENAYQAAKTEFKTLRPPFMVCSAAEAKKKGRKVALRPNWDKQKEQFMELLLFEKFSKNRDLGDKLLATGMKFLIEGNWWGDTYWGECNGVGKNRLGVLLMRVRDKIKSIRQKAESAASYE